MFRIKRWTHRHSTPSSEAIDALRRGEMIIVVDDEKRENEGDLVAAAENITAGHH